ncbi:MAG TPA: hypothetical protein VFO77_09930 [Actinoplanes sp.]|nr:hypothetical protein [Actinoplanes sp.]
MFRLSDPSFSSLMPGGALPGARAQAHHALTLLGAPAPARLVVGVHGALFPGDLSVGSLTAELRDEERTVDTAKPYHLCVALTAADLTPAAGLVALSTWPLACRIVTATSLRVDALTAVVRVAEFAAVRAGASRATAALLRELAAQVPGGPEAVDVLDPGALADAARAALAEPALADAAARDRAIREHAAVRAAELDRRQQLFGVRVLPRPRGLGARR